MSGTMCGGNQTQTRVKEMDCHALGNIREEYRMGDNGPKWGSLASHRHPNHDVPGEKAGV